MKHLAQNGKKFTTNLLNWQKISQKYKCPSFCLYFQSPFGPFMWFLVLADSTSEKSDPIPADQARCKSWWYCSPVAGYKWQKSERNKNNSQCGTHLWPNDDVPHMWSLIIPTFLWLGSGHLHQEAQQRS